jgi:hypothetical protein
MLNIELLNKNGGARLYNTSTYKVSCESNNIKGHKSLKAAHEVGLGTDEFTHVLIATLNDHKEVIVKAHDATSAFTKNELKCSQQLQTFRNTVRHICDFKCTDSKQRWLYDIKKQVTLCQPNGKDLVHFIVMEYIKDGGLDDFLKLIDSYDEKTQLQYYKSLFLQIALGIMEMGSVYKVYHGDLNTGNMLIYKTTKSHLTYRVFDKEYKVKTNGFYPIFIDFGRGGLYDKQSKNRSLIVDDIVIAFTVMNAWISSQTIKKKVTDMCSEISEGSRRDLDRIIGTIKQTFT